MACPAHGAAPSDHASAWDQHPGGTGPPPAHPAQPALPDRVAARPPELTGPDAAPPVDPSAASEFLWRYFKETETLGLASRTRDVRAEIAATGTYAHTFDELKWACRVSWRNADRCVGRAGWASLVLRDRRHVTNAAGMAAETIEHAREATNGGRIRSTMTVFAPAAPGEPGPRLWNEQIIRYAGDPRYAGFLKVAQRHGWGWNGDPWALLPLIIDDGDGVGPQLFDVPADAALEVRISHPHYPGLASLGMRWHALPAITGMGLEAGGLYYPAVPFNGWYVEAEIATSNLASPDRLDMLEPVAEVMGLDRSARWLDWRDHATVVLNQAVLFSFYQAGVHISSHRQESDRLLGHLQREQAAGRGDQESVDWTWVNLPSAFPTSTYHRYYEHQQLSPALIWNRPPASLREDPPLR